MPENLQELPTPLQNIGILFQVTRTLPEHV